MSKRAGFALGGAVSLVLVGAGASFAAPPPYEGGPATYAPHDGASATYAPYKNGRAAYAPGGQQVGGTAQARIIGGREAANVRAAVSLYDGGRFICTATLIAPDSVLAMGHCASKLPTTQAEAEAPPAPRDGLSIRAGSPNRTEGELRQVTQVGLHEDWIWTEPVGAGDIAVLHLDVPILTVTPARVGSPDPSQPVRVIGWGLESPPPPSLDALLPPPLVERLPALPPLPQPEPPTTANQVDLWVVNPDQCEPAQPRIGERENCLTSRVPLTDTCNGDSGAPGFQGDAVVAIVSRGTVAPLRCGLSRTVATDPGDYAAWIAATITHQRADTAA